MNASKAKNKAEQLRVALEVLVKNDPRDGDSPKTCVNLVNIEHVKSSPIWQFDYTVGWPFHNSPNLFLISKEVEKIMSQSCVTDIRMDQNNRIGIAGVLLGYRVGYQINLYLLDLREKKK